MWLLSAVTSTFSLCHTENPPCLPNMQNQKDLIIIVTSVEHVKFGLSALERKENEKTGRREGNMNHEPIYGQYQIKSIA